MAKLQLINHKDDTIQHNETILSTTSTKVFHNKDTSTSWIDKYQPQDLSELPVFHTKVMITNIFIINWSLH